MAAELPEKKSPSKNLWIILLIAAVGIGLFATFYKRDSRNVGNQCLDGCTHGSCSSDGTCQCLAGWLGPKCDTAFCNSENCVHGSCQVDNKCQCDPQWQGNNCDEPSCEQSVCQHGQCEEEDGSCICETGWEGEECETSLCEPTCQNGAMCNPHGVCICPKYYFGDACESWCGENWLWVKGVCVMYVRSRSSLAVAENHCKSFTNGRLFEPNSEQREVDVRDAINATTNAIDYSWLGFRETETQGTYVYRSSGNELSYTNWLPEDQLDDHVKHCVLWRMWDNTWIEYVCSGQYPYVCEIDQN